MMFSLRINLATRKVTVVVSVDDDGEARSRLLSSCVGDKRLNVRDDPFTLFCCAYSAIMDNWAVSDKPISTFLRTKVSDARHTVIVHVQFVAVADSPARNVFVCPSART